MKLWGIHPLLIDEKELVLNALEDDYLNEIGLKNILLA